MNVDALIILEREVENNIAANNFKPASTKLFMSSVAYESSISINNGLNASRTSVDNVLISIAFEEIIPSSSKSRSLKISLNFLFYILLTIFLDFDPNLVYY